MIDMSLYVAAPPRLRPVAARQLVRELASALDAPNAALVFDADGTLWFADVGDDVFRDALERGLLKEDAAEALKRSAARHGLDFRGSASEVARGLRSAYRVGRFPERELFEVMTWCYAGFTPDELTLLAEDSLARGQIARRLNPELAPVLEWARRAGLRSVVVSASPRPIIELAARLWGFAPGDIVAATAAVDSGLFAPRLAAPLPYGGAKVDAARACLRNRSWLASFGDSAFDLEMLLAARVAVAVAPKPELRARISELYPNNIAATCRPLNTTAEAPTYAQKSRSWTRSSSHT